MTRGLDEINAEIERLRQRSEEISREIAAKNRELAALREKVLVQPIPPMNSVAKNMTELPPAAVVKGYDVYSWSSGKAHEKVPSTEVHLSMPFVVEGVEARAVIRLKSQRALDELVGVLLQHRNDVWGDR